VLLHRYALAAQLQAPANWRQRQQRAEPVGRWELMGTDGNPWEQAEGPCFEVGFDDVSMCFLLFSMLLSAGMRSWPGISQFP